MTDWREDLKNLLTDVSTDPIGDIRKSAVAEAAGPPLGAVLGSAPAKAFYTVASIPQEAVKLGLGGAIGTINRGLGGLPGQPGFEPATEAAFQAGGPSAAWEQVRSEEPYWFQAPTEALIDPLNYLGVGAVGRAGKAAVDIAEAGRIGSPVLRGALATAGRGAIKTQDIYTGTGKAILEGVIIPKSIPKLGGQAIGVQPAFRQLGRGITKLSGNPDLLKMNTASRIRGIKDQIDAADRELEGASMYPGPPPTVPAAELPLFHGTQKEGLSRLASEIPLEERGRPNAASTMGVFFTPHEDQAKSYAARKLVGDTGETISGQVYRADNELTNPLLMEQHDFYARFVRHDPASFEDAKAFKEQAIADGYDGVVVFREHGAGDVPRTPESLKPEDIQEIVNFRDIEVRPVHWNPLLSNATNELYDTPVPKLKPDAPTLTYGEFLDTAAAARQADIDTITAKGFAWDPGLKTDAILDIVKDDAQVTKIIKNWAKDHKGDPLHVGGDTRAVARADLVDVLEKDAGVTYTRSTVPSLLVAAWKTVTLATPRFVAQNLQSNMFMQMVKGVRPSFNAKEYYAFFQANRHGRIDVTADEVLESSSITQFWRQDLGKPYAPQEIFRGGPRGFAGIDRYAPNPLGELVGRATKSQKLANIATAFVKPFEDMGMAVDGVARGTSMKQGAHDSLTVAKTAYDQRVAAKLAEVGVTDEVFSTAKKIGLPEEGMFAQPLKRRFMDLGLSEGNADYLVRTWAGVANDAEKVGKAKSNQIMFDYNRTNLDDMVGRFVPFHYWPSRALRFWGEESIRNPIIPLNYMRMTDGMEDAQQNPGMSARQKGFLHVLGTSLGFSLLMNPDALFGFTRLVNLDNAFNEPETEIDPLTGEEVPKQDSFTPQGETELGGVLRFLKEKGIGLYPWYDAAFNVMGTYGNTFEPDFLPIRHKALAGAALNEFRAFTGGDPVGAPYADAMGQLRQGVSTAVSAFLPDGLQPWLAEPVMARAGGSSQEANLDTIIEHEIIAHNPGLTNGQLLEIMSDPHSEQYEYAYQVVSGMGLITELLGVTLPVQAKMRHDARDVVRAQVEVISEEADRQGVLPWELAPTVDDLEFKAKYKRLTGKDYTPGDWESAKLTHDITRAPLEAKPLLMAAAEYHALGTPKQQGHYEAYSAILNGTDPSVAGMSDAGRQQMANYYLDSHPAARRSVDEIRGMRDAYESSHPEFAEFKAWQSRMYDLRDQLGGNFIEYRRQAALISPNAARYFEDQWDYILKNEPDPLKQQERFEQTTASMGAFIAITGTSKLRSVQGPIPGSPTTDTALLAMTPPAPAYASVGNDWSRQLASMQLPGVRPIR